MNRLITILIIFLALLTVLFSYRVKDQRISLVKNLKSFMQAERTIGSGVERLEVVERPIIFDAQRKFLTATYREKHSADCNYKEQGVETCITIVPKLIVVHMTDIPSLRESFNRMNEPVLGEEREKLISRSYDRLNVSAHYLIDKDGTIYKLMPENYMARHAIGVNHNSIGIEHVGMNSDDPTPEQVESSAKLISYLMKKYGIGVDGVRSHAGTAKLKEEGSSLFVENDNGYFEPKNCGDKILAELKGRLLP